MELDEENPVVTPDISFSEKQRFEGEAINAFDVKGEIFIIFKDKLIRSSTEESQTIESRLITKSDTHLAVCGGGIDSLISIYEIGTELKLVC